MKDEIIGRLKALSGELMELLHETETENLAISIYVSNGGEDEYKNVTIYDYRDGHDTLYDASEFPDLGDGWTEHINHIEEADPDAAPVE